jgi:xylulokinase
LPDVTEFAFAARTGCDLLDGCWPDWIDYDLYLGVRDRLPELRHFGEKAGTVSDKASFATGLPSGMTIVMGTTSVTASFLASGARKEGDLHTTVLNNRLTISGISPSMIRSPQDQIRVNKMPNQKWSFSVNSRTGTEWIKAWFPAGTFAELEPTAHNKLPCKYLAYPNVAREESFPFVSNSAEGFITPATEDRVVQFASCLQGTALFERYCYQKLNRLAGTEVPGDIYTGGEWSASDVWMQCRADVTGRINRRMRGQSRSAFGTAMIAALGSGFSSLEDVANAMLAVDATFFPNLELHAQYSELFDEFCELMEGQGYGPGGVSSIRRGIRRK